jgi:hypothetical protein
VEFACTEAIARCYPGVDRPTANFEPPMFLHRAAPSLLSCGGTSQTIKFKPCVLIQQTLPLSSKPEWRKRQFPPENTTSTDSPHACSQAADITNEDVDEQLCFTDMACSTADVSAFCRAVVAKVIPNAFLGDDSNKRIIMYWIDQFISLRRFESLNLHQVTQKLQVIADPCISTTYVD